MSKWFHALCHIFECQALKPGSCNAGLNLFERARPHLDVAVNDVLDVQVLERGQHPGEDDGGVVLRVPALVRRVVSHGETR